MLKPVLALAAGLALSFTALAAQAANVLKVSAIPDEAPTELLRKFKPLGAYLEKELGMKVEFVPVADYPAVVEALATDRLAVGVDINATHTRSATSGIVTGVCTPVHLGRSLTVHEIAVTDDQGRRCSTIRITNMIKDRPAVA